MSSIGRYAMIAFLVLLSIGFIVLAVVTLIPVGPGTADHIHKVGYLGYRSVCPFAPFSTLILIGLGGVFAFATRHICI